MELLSHLGERRPCATRTLQSLLYLWGTLLAVAFSASAAAASSPIVASDSCASRALHLRWRRDVGRSVSLPPRVMGNLLYVAGTEGRMTCLELTGGRKVWSRGFKQPIDAAAVVNADHGREGVVLVALGGTESRLRACAARTGKSLWVQSVRGPVQQLEAKGDSLWLLEKRGRISCRSVSDGRERWSVTFGGWGPPGFLLEGDRLYLLAREDSLIALASATGARIWASRVGGRFAAPPERVGRALALVTPEGEMKAIDPASGGLWGTTRRTSPQILPPNQLGGSGDPSRIDPLLCLTTSSGGTVEAAPLVSGSPDSASAADRRTGGENVFTGGFHWRFDAGKAAVAAPALVGSVVLLGCVDGTITALSADRGTLLWTMKLRGGLRVSPQVVGDLILFTTDQAEVMAFAYSP